MQLPDDNKGACAFQMLQYIKLQVNPQIIVLPATAESALLDAAKAPAAAAAGAAVVDGDEGGSGEVLVQLQRPSMFTYDKVSCSFEMLLMSLMLKPLTSCLDALVHSFCISVLYL